MTKLQTMLIGVAVICLVGLSIGSFFITKENSNLGWSSSGVAGLYSAGNKIGFNTTTLVNTVQFTAGTAVTTTFVIGAATDGARPMTECYWNGTNFTLLKFAANSATPVYSTSTLCQ